MGLYHFPGEVVPVNDCFHCKKFIPYIEIKPLSWYNLYLLPLVLSMRRLVEERASTLLFYSVVSVYSVPTKTSCITMGTLISVLVSHV